MSSETKKAVMKAVPNRWLVFCILTFSGGIAFKLSSMKDMFYVPMQQFMGLTNTQIGGALSAYGIVQTIGLIAGIYVCDLISKKYRIGGSLVGIGLVGFYLATFPGYWGFLVAFGILAILGEVTYWPVLLKAIRLLGDEKNQGRMFGFLEMGRGGGCYHRFQRPGGVPHDGRGCGGPPGRSHLPIGSHHSVRGALPYLRHPRRGPHR